MTSAGVLPSRSTKIVVLPARVKLRSRSTCGASWSVRSSRSVTWSSVSWSVAPGQAAPTTMVRIVNAGSSARPSLKKAPTPAATATIIR